MSDESRFYRWTKLFLENWKVLISLLGFLGFAASGVGNYLQSEEMSETVKQKDQQIAAVAESYQKAYVPRETMETPRVIAKIIKSSCDCSGLEKRLQRLERFH